MSKPKQVALDLKERLARMKKAGLTAGNEMDAGVGNKAEAEEPTIATLNERIAQILGIVKAKPQKATTMNYLILYDIENNKVRTLVAKYLIGKGCIRIQKSVFMANTTHDNFQDIHDTLKDINEFYNNSDSIIVVPINVADVRSMKLIGKNVNIDVLTDPPNTLFF